LPGDDAAPVVADHRGPARPERGDQPGDVRGQPAEAVVADACRPVRFVVAAQVGRHGVEARGGQGRQPVAPTGPEIREAVQQDHDRPRAGFRPVQADLAHVDVAVRPGARTHTRLSSRYLSLRTSVSIGNGASAMSWIATESSRSKWCRCRWEMIRPYST